MTYCVLFWVTLILWAVTSYITKRLHKKHIDAVWAFSTDMKMASHTTFVTHLEELMCQLGTAKQFKAYVHEELDDAGVPADPDPEHTVATGCRIQGRLMWVIARLRVANSLPPRTFSVNKPVRSDAYIHASDRAEKNAK